MRWPGIQSIYGTFLRKTQVFKAEKQWEDLHTRVIEHVSIVLYWKTHEAHYCNAEHPCHRRVLQSH